MSIAEKNLFSLKFRQADQIHDLQHASSRILSHLRFVTNYKVVIFTLFDKGKSDLSCKSGIIAD